jgi:P-type Mg2+ transporter
MDVLTYWQYADKEILQQLDTSAAGLSNEEAAARRSKRKAVKQQAPFLKDVLLFIGQFKSALTLLLIAAVILSAILGERSDVVIILVILLSTGITGFLQERNAGRAVEKLRSLVKNKIKVLRNGAVAEVYKEDIVEGDVLVFSAGDIVVADCLLLEETNLHVNESALTGETYPAEKEIAVIPANTPLSKRSNCLFEGTSVVSGTAKAVVVLTGDRTVFGSLSKSLDAKREESSFETGIRKFGYLLMKITLVLAAVILIVNLCLGRPVIDSILFCLALAVGMAPELLPAIMTVAMASGSKRMAAKKVIVRNLSSIQNLGEVNIFCSDKTGTLTEGILTVNDTVDTEGTKSETVKQLAFINAFYQSGFNNPMDEALRNMENTGVDGYVKKSEIPYDFDRRRLSVLVEKEGKQTLITKGAVVNILQVCSKVMMADKSVTPIDGLKEQIEKQYKLFGTQGLRSVGVCYKEISSGTAIKDSDESDMIFTGFVLLSDPPKAGVAAVINELASNGVALKIITGDNKLVAVYTAEKIGLQNIVALSGTELAAMDEHTLIANVQRTNVFAEVEPQQKEMLIKLIRKAGNTVAYMGDGINDVAAINAADVGISTNNAVDVAKDAADVVLLEKDLAVLNAGILEGRRTFLNTLKYIYTSTSATFGNMFSMAGASLILPFLPMLPQQILMTNFLTDFPYMAVAGDNVDEDELARPQKWNLTQLQNFMLVFGLHSSVFDYLTFFILYRFFKTETIFHTGWFVESICTELLILFVVRTRKSLVKSKPGKVLILLSVLALGVTVALPFTPFAAQLGFTVPGMSLMLIIAGILLVYVITADLIKLLFFKKPVF